MTHPIHAIAFDLDGTLVDSAPDVAHALNTALAEVGLPAFDLATVRSWIGDGPDATIQRALLASVGRRPSLELVAVPHGAAPPAPDALAQQLRASFDAATLRAPLVHGRVYDGITALLDGLARRWPLAVVTNKPTALAHAVLQAARLAQHFQLIYGADGTAERKPSPRLLERAAAALGVQPAALLMVGDGMPDLQAARNAGCPSAWVHWGYGSLPASQPAALAATGASATLWHLRTPGDLLRNLNSVFEAT